MSTTITYSTLSDVNQVIKYNYPGTVAGTTPLPGFYICAIVTNMKTIGSDGSVRDTQNITPIGTSQVTAFTAQQIYTTVNASTAGALLATELKNTYAEATGTVVA